MITSQERELLALIRSVEQLSLADIRVNRSISRLLNREFVKIERLKKTAQTVYVITDLGIKELEREV